MRMFLMLMIMMMSSAFAMAQETYGIKVAGEDITSYNRYDLTEISGVSGKVSFDPNTRTLTLDNATIEADGSNAILNETCDYLTIELIGTNNINVTGAWHIPERGDDNLEQQQRKTQRKEQRMRLALRRLSSRNQQLLVGGRGLMGHIHKQKRGRRGAHHPQLPR